MHSFLERIFIEVYFFIIFVANEIYKILFTERKLIRQYYFINIYIAYRNRAFIMMKFVFLNFSIIRLYNFFIFFIYGFKCFYNIFNLQFSTFFHLNFCSNQLSEVNLQLRNILIFSFNLFSIKDYSKSLLLKK